jgi:hypothetical protein
VPAEDGPIEPMDDMQPFSHPWVNGV